MPTKITPWPVFLDGCLNPDSLQSSLVSPPTTSCRHILSDPSLFLTTFQALFTALSGYFSSFLRSTIRYRSLDVFRLRGRFPRHSDALTNAPYSGIPELPSPLICTRLSLSMARYSNTGSTSRSRDVYWTHTPHLECITAPIRFGLFPFRSPLLRESLLLSVPLLIGMLLFSRLPLP